MARWLIPVTVVEYGRFVEVEAVTKAEALQKARRAEWEEAGDPMSWKVTVIGAVKINEGS